MYLKKLFLRENFILFRKISSHRRCPPCQNPWTSLWPPCCIATSPFSRKRGLLYWARCPRYARSCVRVRPSTATSPCFCADPCRGSWCAALLTTSRVGPDFWGGAKILGQREVEAGRIFLPYITFHFGATGYGSTFFSVLFNRKYCKVSSNLFGSFEVKIFNFFEKNTIFL